MEVPFNSLFVPEEDDEEYRPETVPEAAAIPVVATAPTPLPAAPPIEVLLLLPHLFQRMILQDLVNEDGLLVLGRGMGFEVIAANLLHVLAAPSAGKRSLVIVLNAFADENTKIATELEELSWIDTEEGSTANMFVAIGGAEGAVASAGRAKIYHKGGVVLILLEMFVKDLLLGVVEPNLVTGIVLMHAELCTETLQELFAIHLYREHNQWGFVKALTDEPERLVYGFLPLQDRLKALHLHKTFLWPRFHVEVGALLVPLPVPGADDAHLRDAAARQERQTTLVEDKTPMLPNMDKIQLALDKCIQKCIANLQRDNEALKVDKDREEYFKHTNSLEPDFVRNVRAALAPAWHRVLRRLKLEFFDLQQLSDLRSSLVTDDCLSFYERVHEIIQANVQLVGKQATDQAPWLHLPEAVTLELYAKKRVYDKVEGRAGVGEYLLEEMPKWNRLGHLLADITEDRARMSQAQQASQGPVLVMCSSLRVARQLQRLIPRLRAEGTGRDTLYTARRVMVRKLREHMAWTEMTGRAKREQAAETVEEEPEEVSASASRAPASKRRRTRGASSVARVARLHTGGFQPSEGALDALLVGAMEADVLLDEEPMEVLDSEMYMLDGEEPPVVTLTQEQIEATTFDAMDRSSTVVVQTYNNRTDDLVLQELMPLYIIMYQPDLAFIRRVELHQALHPHAPARVYYMYYGNSVEEEYHLSRIRKEKRAFQKLITERGKLPDHFVTSGELHQKHVPRVAVNTRIAGGSRLHLDNQQAEVVVDAREFRLSLPNLMHRAGIKVVPRMITVGDYVLLPDMVMERKSVDDLIGSLANGRLYKQCQQMFRHYAVGILLIEFDDSRLFLLEEFSAGLRHPPRTTAPQPHADRLSPSLIQAKLVALVLEFPQLRILWSILPHHSVDLVLRLKEGQPQPDLAAAVAAGVDRPGDEDVEYNEVAIGVLQTIPGITTDNYLQVVDKVKNLRQFALMEEEAMAALIGPEAAHKAFRFVRGIH